MSTFEGRSVLVTGGGTGIGKGCALHFLEGGATVTIAGPDGEILESAAAELVQATGRTAVRTAVCDVTDEDLVREAMAVATEAGGLDVLVANAGTGWPGPVELLDKAQWHIAYNVNVVGTALCIKHAAHTMRDRCAPVSSCPPTTSPRQRWTRSSPARQGNSDRSESESTVSDPASCSRRPCAPNSRRSLSPPVYAKRIWAG